MKRIFIIILLITASCYLKGQALPSVKNSRTVVFYNVGKLFDAVNDPGTFDDDFLPEGKRQWTEDRYKKKITDVAKVLSVINENELPAIIGLVEVENQKVVEDIAASSKLRRGKYGIILFDSKDEKGLETALLYKKDEIEIINRFSSIDKF